MQLLNSTEQVENIIAKSSPLNRLESYRDSLMQNSNKNTSVLQGNQESFAHLINPDVTKHGEYNLKQGYPNDLNFFIGPS